MILRKQCRFAWRIWQDIWQTATMCRKRSASGVRKKRIRRSTEREFRNTVKGYHVIDQEKSKYGDQRPGKVCSLSGMDLKYDLER